METELIEVLKRLTNNIALVGLTLAKFADMEDRFTVMDVEETENAKEEPETREPVEAETEVEEVVSFEEVKEKLVEASKAGFKDQMKELILSYGYDRLSDIPTEFYPDIMKKVEAITNAT